MQISLRKRAFPTISFKGAEGLTRFYLVSYNMGQEQRPGSDKDPLPFRFVSIPRVMRRIGCRAGSNYLLICCRYQERRRNNDT